MSSSSTKRTATALPRWRPPGAGWSRVAAATHARVAGSRPSSRPWRRQVRGYPRWQRPSTGTAPGSRPARGWERRAERIAGERVLRALAHHLLETVRRRAADSGTWDQLAHRRRGRAAARSGHRRRAARRCGLGRGSANGLVRIAERPATAVPPGQTPGRPAQTMVSLSSSASALARSSAVSTTVA